jgi:hypothetical protein
MTAEQRDVTEPVPTDKERPDLYRLLIGGLLAVSLLGMLALALLAFVEKAIPDGITALASVAIGALAGMLVRRE